MDVLPDEGGVSTVCSNFSDDFLIFFLIFMTHQ